MIFRMVRTTDVIRLFVEINHTDLIGLALTPAEIAQLTDPAPNAPAEWLEDVACVLRSHARTHSVTNE